MNFKTLAVTAALMAFSAAHAYDSRATTADLDARLARIGPVKVEGTDTVGGKTVAAIFLGARKINNNDDVVDGIRKDHKATATATVFVRDGDDFVRVSTNVLTPEGKRGTGTVPARSAAHDAVSSGKQHCGPIDVLGTAYDSCSSPIKDGSGKIVGVSYIGHKK